MQKIISFAITFLVFIAIDFTWLGFIAKDLYQKQIGTLLKPQPNWLAAIAFYLLFVFGLMFFIIWPNINASSLSKLILPAALFGLITYATYDLTNLAVAKNWSLTITLIDLAWGSFLASSTVLISNLIIKKVLSL